MSIARIPTFFAIAFIWFSKTENAQMKNICKYIYVSRKQHNNENVFCVALLSFLLCCWLEFVKRSPASRSETERKTGLNIRRENWRCSHL